MTTITEQPIPSLDAGQGNTGPRHPRFASGQLVITTNAANRLNPHDVQEGLRRHLAGDWGDLCQEDARLNDQALADGSRILSAYGQGDSRFWIITEADRSVTTILLPEDY